MEMSESSILKPKKRIFEMMKGWIDRAYEHFKKDEIKDARDLFHMFYGARYTLREPEFVEWAKKYPEQHEKVKEMWGRLGGSYSPRKKVRRRKIKKYL
jgi:hypothetical protein